MNLSSVRCFTLPFFLPSPALRAADGASEARMHVLEARKEMRMLLFNYGRYADEFVCENGN